MVFPWRFAQAGGIAMCHFKSGQRKTEPCSIHVQNLPCIAMHKLLYC